MEGAWYGGGEQYNVAVIRYRNKYDAKFNGVVYDQKVSVKGYPAFRVVAFKDGNLNNKGGLYSVEYRYASGGGVPHWNVLLHEVAHTMGAVVDAAPNSTDAGHCNDGRDVMCYADGGARSSYNPNACGTDVFDCNRNDYFNPEPAAGSRRWRGCRRRDRTAPRPPR